MNHSTFRFVCGAGLVAILVLASTATSADPIRELQRCVSIADDVQRLRCYDAIEVPADEPAAQPEPAPAASAPAPVPVAEAKAETIGAEQLPGPLREKEQPAVNVQMRVTRCERDSSRKKYVFYFEGGQVWKQVSDKRLFFRDCDFNVTVTKDMFGYKMQIDGEKSKIRISRLR